MATTLELAPGNSRARPCVLVLSGGFVSVSDVNTFLSYVNNELKPLAPQGSNRVTSFSKNELVPLILKDFTTLPGVAFKWPYITPLVACS